MSTTDATPQEPQPDRVAAWEAVAASTPWPSGWHVEAVAETGSTNTDLLTAAVAGAPGRSVRVTAHQTAGRGRLDRRWDAPPGANLLVSILFRPAPEHPHQATQRVALAAADAVEGLTARRPVLKWPNDLLLDGAKLAGVLAQAGVVDGAVDHVVVGIGLNVGWAPEGAADLGGVVHPLELLQALLAELDAQTAWPAVGHGSLDDRYRARLATLGQRVRVELPTGTVDGRAVDVGADGRLSVLDDCAVTHRIDTGDVVHLRPVTPP